MESMKSYLLRTSLCYPYSLLRRCGTEADIFLEWFAFYKVCLQLFRKPDYHKLIVFLFLAFVRKSMNQIITNNQLTPILGVFQNLVASKVRDMSKMFIFLQLVTFFYPIGT